LSGLAAFFSVRPISRVYGLSRKLVACGIGKCDKVEQMALIEADALLAHAIELAGGDDRDSHEYWDLILVLHRRPEREVFEKAVACCTGKTPSERVVGADVLAQLGTANINGVRPFTTVAALKPKRLSY
jgi:hypothetical protein